jgi:YgiT-type zinc finger domain-containing protein
MTDKYSDCFFCGGVVEEQLLSREVRWQGNLVVFEDVPMGVCTQCGEKVLLPAVAKKIDLTLQERKRPRRTLRVPVYQYQSDLA